VSLPGPDAGQPMRIAVAGATGNIGTRTVAALERAGHEVVRISRSRGVDGLEAALAGVDAVVDATTASRQPAGTTRPEIATGTPQGRYRDVAGPEPQDLMDMARRTDDARGHPVKLVPAWSPALGPEMAGDVLLPGEDARIASTTFDEWLEKPHCERSGIGCVPVCDGSGCDLMPSRGRARETRKPPPAPAVTQLAGRNRRDVTTRR
jgi:uncharacterized protein YbjT (DUF2867 family)